MTEEREQLRQEVIDSLANEGNIQCSEVRSWESYADAVMSVVDRVVAERDEARSQWQTWQNEAQEWKQIADESAATGVDLEMSRLQWAAEAIDADARTDYVRWLHAEVVWRSDHRRRADELSLTMLRGMARRTSAVRKARDAERKSRFLVIESFESLRARVADLEGQLARAFVPTPGWQALLRASLGEAADWMIETIESWWRMGTRAAEPLPAGVNELGQPCANPNCQAATPSDLQVPPSPGATDVQ